VRLKLCFQPGHGLLNAFGFQRILGGGKLVQVSLVGFESFLLEADFFVDAAKPQIPWRIVRIGRHGLLITAQRSPELLPFPVVVPDFYGLPRWRRIIRCGLFPGFTSGVTVGLLRSAPEASKTQAQQHQKDRPADSPHQWDFAPTLRGMSTFARPAL
jgi:hypothetical protein